MVLNWDLLQIKVAAERKNEKVRETVEAKYVNKQDQKLGQK